MSDSDSPVPAAAASSVATDVIAAASPDIGAAPSLSASPSTCDSAAAAPLPTPPHARLLPDSHPRYADFVASLARISKECEEELREEMRAKKVDAGAVRDLLRFHLDKQLALTNELHQLARAEAAAEQPDTDETARTDGATHATAPLLSLPESVLQAHPLIPSSLRGAVWQVLLGTANKDTSLLDGFDADAITRAPRGLSALRPAGSAAAAEDDADAAQEAMAEGVITLALRNSIRIDAQRTRHAMHASPQLVDELEQLLVFYCHSRSVEYKQGLNEILAPILLTMAGAPQTPPKSAANPASPGGSPLSPAPPTPPVLSPYTRGAVYNAFYALISKFLPSIFTDRELESLRTLFRLFRLLFTYHLPELASFVEGGMAGGGSDDDEHPHPIGAEIYATSWFLTLFASQGGCDSLATLQRLWDATLIRDDPFGQYYLAVALLQLHSPFLRGTPRKYLPMALRKVQVTSTNLNELLRLAQGIKVRTPASFRQTMFEVSFAKSAPPGGLAAAVAAAAGGSLATGSSGAPSAALSAHMLEQLAAYSELLPCMTVPSTEVVRQAYSDLESRPATDPNGDGTGDAAASSDIVDGDGSGGGAVGDARSAAALKFIVLDCRPTSEYAAGHLPCAIHLSPSLLHIPSQLAHVLGPKGYGGMKRDCHFVFVGSQMASLSEVATPLPMGAAAAAIAGPARAHALALPSSRRPVPPPSPASSLAALAEAARADEDALRNGGGGAAAYSLEGRSDVRLVSAGGGLNIAVKNLDAIHSGVSNETPVLGGSVSQYPAQMTRGQSAVGADLFVQVGSPLTTDGAAASTALRSPSSSSSNGGVLYRPDTPSSPLTSPFTHQALSHSSAPSPLPSPSSSPARILRTNALLDATTASYVSLFLAHGFPYVSVCEGGYPACHVEVFRAQQAYRQQRAALAAGELTLSAFQTPLEECELISHNAKACLVCNPPAAPSTASLTPDPLHSSSSSVTASPHTPPPSSGESGVKSSSSSWGSARKNVKSGGGGDGFSTPEKSSTSSESGNATPSSSGDKLAASSSTDKTPVASPAAAAAPSTTTTATLSSKFSLGFKKLGASLTEKVNKFKEEQKQKEKEKEKEKAAAALKEENERAAADGRADTATMSPGAKSAPSSSSDTPRKPSGLSVHTDSPPVPTTPARDATSSSSTSVTDKRDDGGGAKASLGSRFLKALGVKKKEDGDKDSTAPQSEVDAAIDLQDWALDENIALFHCHEISLYSIRLPTAATPTTTPTPTTPATPVKRQGVLLPRVLAVTAGYVLTFQPAQVKAPAAVAAAASGAGVPAAVAAALLPAVVRSTSSADDAALAAAERATAAPFGLAYLKSKHRLVDLERITSKKDRPSVLTFHWKAPVEVDAGPAPPIHMPSHTSTASTATAGGDMLSPSPLPSPSSLSHANGSFDAVSLQTPSSSFIPHDNYPSVSGASATSPIVGTAAAASSASSGVRKSASSPRGPSTMFLIDHPKECIAIVRSKFLLAKAAAALALTNRQVQVGHREEDTTTNSSSSKPRASSIAQASTTASNAVSDDASSGDLFSLASGPTSSAPLSDGSGALEMFDAPEEHDVSEPPSPTSAAVATTSSAQVGDHTDAAAAPRIEGETLSPARADMLAPAAEDLLDL